METAVIWICMFILAIAFGTMTGMLIVYVRDSRQENAINNYAKRPTFYHSTSAYGRCWYIELWDVATGQAYAKSFCGQIILGRDIGRGELFWQMRVGTDPTISREQCVIYDQGGFLLIENVSQTNMTRLNGCPLTMPYTLYQDYQLSMGRSTFLVSRIKRVA